MPVIPYPRVDRALHQVNRHQVERRPGWEPLVARSADGEITVSDWVQSRFPRTVPWPDLDPPRVPGQRTSSDG